MRQVIHVACNDVPVRSRHGATIRRNTFGNTTHFWPSKSEPYARLGVGFLRKQLSHKDLAWSDQTHTQTDTHPDPDTHRSPSAFGHSAAEPGRAATTKWKQQQSPLTFVL